MRCQVAFLFAFLSFAALRAQTPPPIDPASLTTTASGLKYVITSKGNGPTPMPGQIVVVHYNGTLADSGKKFDSSRDRNQPFAFTLGQGRVIKGWDEGFALLHVGDKATLIIPSDLAYGDRQRGPIPAKATLRFDVELLEVRSRGLADALQQVLDAEGPEAAQRRFDELKLQRFEGYFVSEEQLNGLGYAKMKSSLPDAIVVLKWNVELFPNSANVYDSLAEAYMKNGQRDLAISNYEKSLSLDPKNENAMKMLSELRASAATPKP